MPLGDRERAHGRCNNPVNPRQSVINSHKVPASGEAVNDSPPRVRKVAPAHRKDRRLGVYSETRRGRILSGIGENPDKTALFPRISKSACGHYDSGHCSRIVEMHSREIGWPPMDTSHL